MNGKEEEEGKAVASEAEEEKEKEETTAVKQDISISEDKVSSQGDKEVPALQDNGKEEIEEKEGEVQEEKQSQGIVVTVKDTHAYLRSPSMIEELKFYIEDIKTEKENIKTIHEILSPGDDVGFIVGERKEGELRALKVRKLEPGEYIEEEANDTIPKIEGEGQYREHGIITRLKDTNGFISRPRPYLGRLFFHFKYVRADTSRGGGLNRIEIGSEVSYIVCHEDTRMFAADVVVLPKGTVIQEVPLPGKFVGHVIRPATAPSPDNKPDDGLIGYTDENGIEQKAFYGHHNVENQEIALDERDEVEFSVFNQIYKKEGRAIEVKLIEKASEQREFGKVSVLKGTFGFIKCCERHNDMMFHFDDLDGIEASRLQIADDLVFTVRYDINKGKQVAIKVTKAAPGSAVFETISEEVFYGIVVERLGLWKSYGPTNNGIIIFEGDDGNSEKLIFGPTDLEDRQLNPQVGDKVSFRIAVNLAQAKAAEKLEWASARFGGRRATQVSLVKYMGRVTSIVQNGSYGFIDYDHERGTSHIFFHSSEVGKNITLVNDDIVQFVRVYNPNKQQHQARRVIRIQQADSANAIPLVQNKRDHKIQLEPQKDGNSNSTNTIKSKKGLEFTKGPPLRTNSGTLCRIARGPDGTKGFNSGRTHNELKMNKDKLDPSAVPFIPRSLSIQSVGGGDGSGGGGDGGGDGNGGQE